VQKSKSWLEIEVLLEELILIESLFPKYDVYLNHIFGVYLILNSKFILDYV